ncbi:MAG: sigma-70 family RNA polymerase sigma factor [Hahellaceae bacterium]|nr:sigma-70 family RNA polymerase sigma factor [Hahellaceae bacterium]MCP5210006.1 sigma-70 family RNA polymerase sigma factor [Hahellaceae bacterium]
MLDAEWTPEETDSRVSAQQAELAQLQSLKRGRIRDISVAESMDIYSRDIARIDLLTVEEERSLGGRIDDVMRQLLVELASDEYLLEHLETLLLKKLSLSNAESFPESALQESPQTYAVMENITLTVIDTLKCLYFLSQHHSSQAHNLRSNLALLVAMIELERSNVLALVEQVKETLAADISTRVTRLVNKYVVLRNQLIEKNLRLVFLVAKRSHLGGVALEELIQDGNLGLIKASDRFNFGRGFRFSTYAYWCIHHVMKLESQKKRYLIARPSYLMDKLAQVIDTKERFAAQRSRLPSEIEISAATSLPVAMVSRIQEFPAEPVSINQPLNDDTESTLEPLLASTEAGPELLAEDYQKGKLIESFKDQLSAREYLILRMRYGVGFRKEYTLGEVGDQLGLTFERVRQLQKQALKKVQARYPANDG